MFSVAQGLENGGYSKNGDNHVLIILVSRRNHHWNRHNQVGTYVIIGLLY